MRLSYIIVTHNRRDALLRTLEILRRTTPLPQSEWETLVVDNGSDDGTPRAVQALFPEVRLICLGRNEGVWARSYAFAPARGRYVVLLDDDSYPVGDAVVRSMAYLDVRPRCAAVVGRALLPDGSAEACAMPAVMLSGAVCLRRSVLAEVGPFRREFFRKAGEYDFSFRIWEAGYTVERFEDIIYRHDKVGAGRNAAFAHRMDIRNNLILVERYLPPDLRQIYHEDWAARYTALAIHAGHAVAARRALLEARLWRMREALRGRQTLSEGTIEAVFALRHQARAVRRWSNVISGNSVVIADFSKNIYATYRACLEAGLTVSAVADNNPAFLGHNYRGVPILADAEALARPCAGVAVSNVNPAQIDGVIRRIRCRYDGPILRLWEPRFLGSAAVAA